MPRRLRESELAAFVSGGCDLGVDDDDDWWGDGSAAGARVPAELHSTSCVRARPAPPPAPTLRPDHEQCSSSEVGPQSVEPDGQLAIPSPVPAAAP